MTGTKQAVGVAFLLTLVLAGQPLLSIGLASKALALGLISPAPCPARTHLVSKKKSAVHRLSRSGNQATSHQSRRSRQLCRSRKSHKLAPELPVPLPQDLTSLLQVRTVAPGVVYKSFKGRLSINVIDADLINAPVIVRPVIAGNSYHHLADVKSHARQSKAIAAVNANYFKKDGTPLGTLVIDREWVAGPLYGRVSLGVTGCGYVRIDCVDVHGILTTNNPEVSDLWVNNINQPRRTGCHVIAYTRRWGDRVVLPYAGVLVAVDRSGQVIDKKTTIIDIPPGGFVLSDTKDGLLSKLEVGEEAKLSWHTTPDTWSDVVAAVSGGPMLLKNGQLYVDLKAERFKNAWTGRSIKARTAAGVTAGNHLLLVTVEGPHTLWDMAKLLQKLGAVEAMNLDGGGSTTMVVNGNVVTRNATSVERRVASALSLVPAPNVVSTKLPPSSAHRFSPRLIDMPKELPLQPPVMTPAASEPQPGSPLGSSPAADIGTNPDANKDQPGSG